MQPNHYDLLGQVPQEAPGRMTRDAIQQNSRDANTNPHTNTPPNVLQSRPSSGAAVMRPEGM